ncbi:MAG: hypothetical protein ACYC1W_02885 [Gemmatimonadaceae bacterium]
MHPIYKIGKEMTPELTIGIDPVKVKLEIPSSSRIREFFRGEDPLSRIRVIVAHCSLFIQKEDEGSCDLSLWVLNFSKRSLIPDALNIHQWAFLSRTLPELPTTIRGLTFPIRSRDLQILSAVTQLNTAAIRRIRDASPQVPAQAVGCNWGLSIYAQLHFREAQRPVDVQLQIPNPQVQFYWYLER